MNQDSNIEKDLFAETLELPPDQREGYLKGACRSDEQLRLRVEDLLRVHGDASRILQTKGEPRTILVDPPLDEDPGTVIDRYKLLQKIGEGGCGVVYMAEQEEPVRRRVALKVIKLGMDTKSVIARFEAERQALALMDHPNIAKVFDAGATEEGRPYFVMELVRGVKITEYCDEHHLSTRDRLDLFIKVCQAIQHAHQKGIIHRDIKPSNVLVTLHDGVAVPKVIDFGIAKATTDQRLTDKTLFTALEQFIGTPAYMSPEQAEMSGLDIDTRSDIYSLGVLLYELLTGKTPFDAKELFAFGLDEMRRTIREKEPLRPSTRLNQTLLAVNGNSITSSSAKPLTEEEIRVNSRRLLRIKETITLLRGDVDWIVMKCLEKDRARRYETAAGLASDIQRHLNSEAVLARPASAAYRFQKLVRRNKLTVFAGTAVATALACGLVLSLWQSVRARRAERETRQQLYVSDMVVAEKALREGNLRRADELLRAHVSKAGASEDSPGFEHHYLSQRCNGEQDLILATNENAMFAVAYSPDGKLLAIGSSYLQLRDYSGDLKLYSVESGRLLKNLETHSPDGIRSVAFSPDGKRLAAGGAGSVVTIWDVATHQRLDWFFGRLAEVGTVAFSPDGRLLAASFFSTSPGTWGRVLLWDTETREAIKEIDLDSKRPEALAFSPDGKRLVFVESPQGTNDGHTLITWEIQAKRDGRPVELPFVGAINSIQFSPDSRTIALGAAHGFVALWDFGHPPRMLGEHLGDVLSVAFSKDGRLLASSSADNTVKIWDLQSQQNIRILRGHRDSVKQVAFSPDGTRLASASLDKTVRLWSVVSNDQDILHVHDKEVTAVEFHPNGRLLATASRDNTLRIVDPLRGDIRYSVTNLTNTVWSLAFSPDGMHLLAGDSSHTISVWQTETWRHLDDLTTFSPDQRGVFALRFSADGRFAFAAELGFASVWDTGSWRPATNLPSPGGGRLRVTLAVSPDNRFLALASGRVAQLHEIGSWRPGMKFRHPSDIGTLAFSADCRNLITGSTDAQVRLWDMKNGSAPSTVLGGFVGAVSALAVSPDGSTLAVADASPTIKLWNLTTRKELFTLVGHRTRVSSLAFSPDGRTLSSGSVDATIRLWRGIPENDSKTRTRK